MNEIVQHEPNNPWLRAAAAASAGTLGKLLKFAKGKYEVGDDTLPDGTELVAHIDQLVRGWVKFENGKVATQRLGRVADGFEPPQREELPDNDKSLWEKDNRSGVPRDPWTEQWYLPLTDHQSGELLTFVTGSKGGIRAIGSLCSTYGRSYRDGLLPVVALKIRSYRHDDYGRIETPDFQIVGWEGSTTSPPAQQRIEQPRENAVGQFNDMVGDSIPF